MAKRLLELVKKTRALFGERKPEWFRDLYIRKNRPMTKYYNLLTLNLRMLVLFLFVLLKKPEGYFVFELTILNALLLYVILRQNLISRHLAAEIESSRAGGP